MPRKIYTKRPGPRPKPANLLKTNVSIPFTPGDIERLDVVAEELNESRTGTVRLAVERFFAWIDANPKAYEKLKPASEELALETPRAKPSKSPGAKRGRAAKRRSRLAGSATGGSLAAVQRALGGS